MAKNKKPEKEYKKVNFKDNWKIYWSFLRKYKWLFFFTAFIVLINEVFSFVEKYLFKTIVDNGTSYGAGTISLEAITSVFLLVAVVYLATTLLKIIFKWISLHFVNSLESKLITDLKQHFFDHIISLSHSFHITHKTGSLISRIGRGAGGMERLTDFLVFNVFPVLFQLFIVGTSLLYFDAISAGIVIATILVFLAYSLFLQNIQTAENEKLNRIEDIEKANLADFVTNIDSIKYYGKEQVIKSKYTNLTKDTSNALVRFWNYYRWLDAGQNLILGLGTFFLIFFSVKSFLAGNISIGTVVFIYTIYGGLFASIYGFMHGVRGYYRSMTDFHDLFQYGKIEQEVKDNPNAHKLKINHGSVEFRNVDFNYGNKKLFDDFNLKIKPGEKVALVGHSGSGKSTLVKLLYRFYDVNSGSVLIDDNDVKNVEQESLRSELSIVPQEAILFDDTIYNNVLFSRPNATRKEVLQAIKFAQLDKTVASFPYKENTIVGERGVKLSGGEKQRVSIARAILADKKVLVLDEATSSLDSETEHEIQSEICLIPKRMWNEQFQEDEHINNFVRR